jgi:hypothetical protein
MTCYFFGSAEATNLAKEPFERTDFDQTITPFLPNWTTAKAPSKLILVGVGMRQVNLLIMYLDVYSVGMYFNESCTIVPLAYGRLPLVVVVYAQRFYQIVSKFT